MPSKGVKATHSTVAFFQSLLSHSFGDSNGPDGYNYSSDTREKQSINFIVKCQAETISTLAWSCDASSHSHLHNKN